MSGFSDDIAFARPMMFDYMGEPVYWDGTLIEKAIVEDLEDSVPDHAYGTARTRKKISVRDGDLNVVPEPGDEIRLTNDTSKAGGGDYWTVERVTQTCGICDVTFFRYESR